MYTIHEGEVLFKEKYAGTDKSRLYVRPPEQDTLVTIVGDSGGELTNILKRIFLPHGYPNSVSKDYTMYQVWDTAQAFCSTITGILATQEVLRGVGVGDVTATPLAATITWVLKDGCGHIGRILFAFTHGTYLDAYSKKWRLYADTLNDAAMCMEIALPLYRHFTTTILCVSTVMKSIVGVAGGATRVAMTQHHAIRGNMADVSAKDSAQETAVNLIGSITALFIISTIGNSITIFAIMIALHIIFNYFAVRSICLRTLNEPRFLQVIEAYLREEVIATPCKINMNEPIVFYQIGSNLLDLKICGFKIKVGVSVKHLMEQNMSALYVKNINEVYQYREYILFPDLKSGKMYVVLRDTAAVSDTLCAYFHAVLLSIITCAINDVPLAAYKTYNNISRPFADVCRTLQEERWSRSVTQTPSAKFAYDPSLELMKFVDKIVQKEWRLIHRELQNIGWDLNKHLLIVDEWRICKPIPVTETRPVDEGSQSSSKAPSRRSITTFDAAEYVVSDSIRDTYTIEPEIKSPKIETKLQTKLI